MGTSAPPLLVGRSRLPIYITAVALLAIGVPLAATQLRSGSFLPHWYCYLGNGPLTWTHVTSDLMIGFSYVAISCTLLLLVRKSQGTVPFHWMILAFGLFIVACGGTHFMEVLTIWKPVYWVSAAVKVVTAAASISTAVALPMLSPTILRRIEEARAAAEQRTQLESAHRELKSLYRELRESDRLKDALVAQNAARIGDWSWDVRTGKNVWSEAVEVMHGIAPGAYDGRYESWWATVHSDDKDRVTAAVQRALETGDYEVEYRTLRPDNSTYWTAARGKVVYGSDGKPEKLIGICMDVTGRKANEEALLRAEKLAAAGRLAATVAHEINNPLEAVMNLVYLARNTDGDNRALLEQADRELARVSAIAKQTLGFYRDTSSPTEVAVKDVVAKVLETYRSKLDAKQLEVNLEVASEMSLFLRRGDLHQVVANLVANAIDASMTGGQIEIRIFNADAATVVIEVCDQGSGIAPNVAKRIFEPFFTTKKDVGTGLGLWVSKRLIEQMGGRLTFDSDANPHSSGTCFRIQLPLTKAESATA